MFSDVDKIAIGTELERLCITHGWKKIDEKSQLVFINTMENWHRSSEDVVKAIQALYDSPMANLSLSRIREAVASIQPIVLPERTDTHYKTSEYRTSSRRVFGRTKKLRQRYGRKWFLYYNSDVESYPLCADDEKYYKHDLSVSDIVNVAQPGGEFSFDQKAV